MAGLSFDDLVPDDKRKPVAFDDLVPTEGGDTSAAVGRALINGIPVVGPAVLGGVNRAVAGIRSLQSGNPYADELATVQRFSDDTAAQHPTATTVGGVAGAVLGTAPLIAAAPAAFGASAAPMAMRMGASGLTGGLLGGADAAARSDGDLGETKTGAMYGALGGFVAPPVASAIGGLLGRAVSPIRTDPARAPLVETLEREGINLTAGQRTGSKPLQWAESVISDMPLAGGGAKAAVEQQGLQFNKAAARRMGEDAELLTPDVMKRAADRIGGQFNELSGRNTLQVDLPFTQDIAKTAQEYRRVLPSQQRETFNNMLDDIVGAARNGEGAIPGDVYQETRSRLSRIATNSRTDPEYADAMRGLRRALDSAMERSISPADAEAWQAARQQYASMKTLEKAMAGAGEKAAQGYLSPQQLRTAVKGANAQAYVRGEGDLAELARAGAGAMQPLPNSGTTPRAFMQGLFTGGGAVSGGIPGAAAGILGPAIGGRVLMSRPVQSYLSNQAAASVEPSIQRAMGLLTAPAPLYANRLR